MAHLVLLLTFFTSADASTIENWPGWRGPRSDGSSRETNLPTQWNASTNVRWKTAIPGRGHSSPIVWGDRVFVTSCIEEERKRILLCLDRTGGGILWQRVVAEAALERKHKLNSHASSTPATDGGHVWATFLDFPKVLVVCYAMDGSEVWRVSPGELHSVHGFCSPPLLYKDLVILNGDQDGDGYLVALDQRTGKQRWITQRPNRTRSYCPPVVFEAAGRRQLVLSGSKCVASYDPDTGKQIWLLDGPTEQFVASLVHQDNLFFLTAGYPTYHVLAIRDDGVGNITQTHIAWHETKGAGYVPSPIAHGGWLFLVADNGIASCFEAGTGKRLWLERLGKHHSASPVVADGRLYFTDDDGTTLVVAAEPVFRLLARNRLGEECYASPAISHGCIFLRAGTHLYCIGNG